MALHQNFCHVSRTLLFCSLVFFCPNSLESAFESEKISPLQNAAGAFPFSLYANSLGAISDPTIISNNQSLFSAGSHHRKFGLKSLTQSCFVIGGTFHQYGVGLGLSRFGNPNYSETQVSILGGKNYKELVQIGISLNMYQLSITNYGQAVAIGSRVTIRYAMGSNVESIISLLNVNRPVLGQSREKLPQVISTGFLAKPHDQIRGQVSLVQDTEFPISVRLGLIYKPFNQIAIAVGKVHQPNIFTTGGYIHWKNFRIEIGYLSHANLGLSTYQTGISYTRIP